MIKKLGTNFDHSHILNRPQKNRIKTIVLLTFSILLGGYTIMNLIPQLGAKITGTRLERIQSVPNFKDGVFINELETPMKPDDVSYFTMIKDFLRGGENRKPEFSLQTNTIDQNKLTTKSAPSFIWLGHSSVMLKLGGKHILFDPVFSGNASPFSFMGPKQYAYSTNFTAETIHSVDVIVISHDHYDHLDYKTIVAYKDSVSLFVVPLGVGAHLEKWGIDSSKIQELNWWESFTNDGVEYTAAPARHFSGRGLTDRNATLWASWIVSDGISQIFFGGDSGYGPHFKEIAHKFNGFDMAFIECGQYNQSWPFIHMMPEETVQAAIDLNAKCTVPIHWGKFTLSLHTWTEPIERFISASNEKQLTYYTPIPGEIFDLQTTNTNLWWK